MAERLGDPRIQAFLAARAVVVLATLQPDGSPLAMPMWFLPGPDTLTMISVAGTQKVRNLSRDARVCVVAEAATPAGDIQGVTVQGRAAFLTDPAAQRLLADGLLARYHPHLERRWGGRAMPADRVMFRIVPSHISSWGLNPS